MSRFRRYHSIFLAVILLTCFGIISVLASSDNTVLQADELAFMPMVTYSPRLFIVSIFHDRNGNESRDPDEPSVSGVVVRAEGLSCTTDKNGICEFVGIEPSNLRLGIDSSHADIERLSFLFLSGEVLSTKEFVEIDTAEITAVILGLGQGPFTIPIAEESFLKVGNRFGEIHDLYGQQVPHPGLDIEIKGDGPQPIYSPVAGRALPGPDGAWGECNHVTIWYTGTGLDVGIGLGHLTEVVVKPDTAVEKGDLIGYIDPSLYYPGFVACTSHPHIHMNIWGSVPGETWPKDETGPWEILPPGEWGWLDPENYLPEIGNPLPMFPGKLVQ